MFMGGAEETQAGSVFQLDEGDCKGTERLAGGWLVWDDRGVDGLRISVNYEDHFIEVRGDCDFAAPYRFDLRRFKDCSRDDVDGFCVSRQFTNLVFELTPDSCVH
jgi:hypothetical protein